MRTANISCLLVLLALPLAACDQGPDDPPELPNPVEEGPERSATPPPASTYTVPSATGPGSPTAQRITVVNTLPYPVEITASYDGTTQPLGTLGTDTKSAFFIQAPMGTRVRLIATPVRGGRSLRQTITLDDGVVADWIIESATPE